MLCDSKLFLTSRVQPKHVLQVCNCFGQVLLGVVIFRCSQNGLRHVAVSFEIALLKNDKLSLIYFGLITDIIRYFIVEGTSTFLHVHLSSFLSKLIQHLDMGAAADGGRLVCPVGANKTRDMCK